LHSILKLDLPPRRNLHLPNVGGGGGSGGDGDSAVVGGRWRQPSSSKLCTTFPATTMVPQLQKETSSGNISKGKRAIINVQTIECPHPIRDVPSLVI